MTDDKKIESIPVIVTDTEGIEREFAEEVVIPFNGEKFAVLVSIPDSLDDEEDPDVVLTKLITNEHGEQEYVSPSDDEFEAVAAIYEKM